MDGRVVAHIGLTWTKDGLQQRVLRMPPSSTLGGRVAVAPDPRPAPQTVDQGPIMGSINRAFSTRSRFGVYSRASDGGAA